MRTEYPFSPPDGCRTSCTQERGTAEHFALAHWRLEQRLGGLRRVFPARWTRPLGEPQLACNRVLKQVRSVSRRGWRGQVLGWRVGGGASGGVSSVLLGESLLRPVDGLSKRKSCHRLTTSKLCSPGSKRETTSSFSRAASRYCTPDPCLSSRRPPLSLFRDSRNRHAAIAIDNLQIATPLGRAVASKTVPSGGSRARRGWDGASRAL